MFCILLAVGLSSGVILGSVLNLFLERLRSGSSGQAEDK